MKSSLKNEADILDKYEKSSAYPKYDEKYACERRVDQERLMKWSTYQKSISSTNKFGETESYSFTDSHNNHQPKYAIISSSLSRDENGHTHNKYIG